jgi:hypothetical protein
MPPNFVTRDLGLASTLLSYGHAIVQVELQFEGMRGRPTGYWAFADTPDLQKIVRDYWAGTCRVDPRAFLSNMRDLKKMVVSMEKAPKNS